MGVAALVLKPVVSGLHRLASPALSRPRAATAMLRRRIAGGERVSGGLCGRTNDVRRAQKTKVVATQDEPPDVSKTIQTSE